MTNETTIILRAARAATIDAVLAAGTTTTNGGKAIDDHQVHAERIAYAATEVAAAEALAAYAADRRAAGRRRHHRQMAAAFAGEIAAKLRGDDRGPLRTTSASPTSVLGRTLGRAGRCAAAIRAAQHESRLREIGREVDPDPRRQQRLHRRRHRRDGARLGAASSPASEVAPLAEHIHRHDELVPESILSEMGELGYFGLSVPEKYGGHGIGNLAMILTTEELSRRRSPRAGCLITRPEILTKALLEGGTEAAEAALAAAARRGRDDGRHLGDRARHRLRRRVGALPRRARRARRQPGWFITGAKAWCTFAGRADVIALLARTDPDPKLGARACRCSSCEGRRSPATSSR